MALTREQVVNKAMELIDDGGLDALSLRTLAAALGVRAPTLYWHVKNKSELLDAVADVIMDEAIGAIPEPRDQSRVDQSRRTADGREWLLEALEQLRAAMLRHRDGARIVSGARFSLRRADFSEHAMATLVDHGVELRLARLLTLAGERYTVGWVLEEQAPPPESAAPRLDDLEARFPVVTRAIAEYFHGTGRTADDLYRDGARLVLQLDPEIGS